MTSLLALVVFTSNILGSFNDPFEFAGNYGDEVNPIREYVFEQVVSKEALASNLTRSEITQLMENENPSPEEFQQYHYQIVRDAIQEDLQHGPTLGELVSFDLIEFLLKKQLELQNEGFSEDDLSSILYFIDRYSDKKVFSFFRHNPSELLSLDKILRDKAASEGRSFDLPILSSTEPLIGVDAFELKSQLLEVLFTNEILNDVKAKNKLLESIDKLDPNFLKHYLGPDAENTDLVIFTSPAGQVFFYWLYQSLNLHLIAENAAMIPQINKVKQVFANTLGDPIERAKAFRNKLVAADASLVFTQESDAIVPQLLTENRLFHPVGLQNSGDGTLVFLRRDIWEPTYQIIPIDDYEGYERGRLNVILATRKDSGEKFLLAASHGNSTKSEDGRLQITKVVEKFNRLSTLPENRGLQLVIGADANTKSDEDVRLLREHLDALGLVATSVGPTTIKKRMVTAQHPKAGRSAVDEEDYIIILKPENDGRYQMINPTVGFQDVMPDLTITLPNVDNPSDHYPVGVTLDYIPMDVSS